MHGAATGGFWKINNNMQIRITCGAFTTFLSPSVPSASETLEQRELERNPLVVAQGAHSESGGAPPFFISFFFSPFSHTPVLASPQAPKTRREGSLTLQQRGCGPRKVQRTANSCCSFPSVSSHAVAGSVPHSKAQRAPTFWPESLREPQVTGKY